MASVSFCHHWGWHEGVAFGRLVASDWNFWWLLQQLQIVWSSDSLEPEDFAGDTVRITDPSLFVVQTPTGAIKTWTSTWHGRATHCPGLEESFPWFVGWSIDSPLLSCWPHFVCFTVPGNRTRYIPSSLKFLFRLCQHDWLFPSFASQMSTCHKIFARSRKAVSTLCWMIAGAVQMLPGIFDAPKLGDFRSGLQVTGTLEELGRTWKNLDADLRCSTRAAQPQPLEIGTRFGRARCKALVENGEIWKHSARTKQGVAAVENEQLPRRITKAASISLVNHAFDTSIFHRRWPIQWRGCWNSMQRLRESTATASQSRWLELIVWIFNQISE